MSLWQRNDWRLTNGCRTLPLTQTHWDDDGDDGDDEGGEGDDDDDDGDDGDDDDDDDDGDDGDDDDDDDLPCPGVVSHPLSQRPLRARSHRGVPAVTKHHHDNDGDGDGDGDDNDGDGDGDDKDDDVEDADEKHLGGGPTTPTVSDKELFPK